MEKRLYFFTDGASRNNGKKDKNKQVYGGYGGFITDDSYNIIVKDDYCFKDVTNNQMELFGFIRLFEIFLRHYNFEASTKYVITVVSDSQYLIKGINEWLPGWKKRSWKNNEGSQIKNYEMWRLIDDIITSFRKIATFEFVWERGHSGKDITLEKNPFQYFNEQCDTLATSSVDDEEKRGNNYNFINIVQQICKFMEGMIQYVANL